MTCHCEKISLHKGYMIAFTESTYFLNGIDMLLIYIRKIIFKDLKVPVRLSIAMQSNTFLKFKIGSIPINAVLQFWSGTLPEEEVGRGCIMAQGKL